MVGARVSKRPSRSMCPLLPACAYNSAMRNAPEQDHTEIALLLLSSRHACMRTYIHTYSLQHRCNREQFDYNAEQAPAPQSDHLCDKDVLRTL